MKVLGSKTTFIITLMIATLAGLFGVGGSSALASGPEDAWDGHIWNPSPHESHTFSAPANAVAVEVVGYWGWSGSPSQHQHNETHAFSANGHIIECIDFGDEELDGQWLRCGSVKFAQTDDLTVDVNFTGDDSSSGSHYFKAEVKWEVAEPASCQAITVDRTEINSEGELVHVTVKANNADQYRIVRLSDGETMATGDTNNLSFTAMPGEAYQAQVRFGNDPWTTEGCEEFQFAPTPVEPVPVCEAITVDKTQINPEGELVHVTVKAINADQYRIIRQSDGKVMATGSTNNLSFTAMPWETYQAQTRSGDGPWTTEGCNFEFGTVLALASCSMTTSEITSHEIMVKELGAKDENQRNLTIIDWQADSNFALDKSTELTTLNNFPVVVGFPSEPGNYWVQFKVKVQADNNWVGGKDCLLEIEIDDPCPACGQYQDFIGAVPFGTYTPYLEAGKEYFDMTRSIMYNIEYVNDQQADIVYRFNGQEMDDVTTSIFYGNGTDKLAAGSSRANYTFDDGVTKLISYRYGAEQARIFQKMNGQETRWIQPLDQPFEHKYDFEIIVHGPANSSDLLIFGDEQRQINYNDNGLATVALTFDRPGLVSIYSMAGDDQNVEWVPVDWMTYPITETTRLDYNFAEIGLYHYRLIDQDGQVVAGPTSSSTLSFEAKPGFSYQAQLAYPETSLFVGLYDDMKFQHPDYWLMPVDGRAEHDFEFHLDYHRLSDPDLGNDHIRGDVVVDGLTLSYGTTSVAQQFPYGRHDGARPGVNIVGIPNVSMIAYCQRPGYHEVVYWGGWENESYYLPERSWIFDDEMAEEWNDDQRGECIDAARRVNMELARQGLRTDHTFRHHGEQSQGYQMVQQNIWSPYNLVGMRPPHVGQILQPGTVLPYYENPEDSLFWGWDLDKGTLADGIGAYELQAHVAALGAAQYVDMTGIHPADEVFVPEMPAAPAIEASPEEIEPAQAEPTTEPAVSPEPETDQPQDSLDTEDEPAVSPEPTQPEPAPEPPIIIPSTPEAPQV
ncbi:MAG: hypothetical protein KDI62_03525 [Anaerolineae bacterium]|nr:hypothetical protein [Anaerolineae bacterium]MCB9104874.1 hypothetical protein [Anaerolineales bacterium]